MKKIFSIVMAILLALPCYWALADDVNVQNTWNASISDQQWNAGLPGLSAGGGLGGVGNIDFSGAGHATDPVTANVEGSGIGAYNVGAQTGLTIAANPALGILAQIGNDSTAGMNFSTMTQTATGTTIMVNQLNARIDPVSSANIGTAATDTNYVVTGSISNLNFQGVRDTSGTQEFPGGLTITNTANAYKNSVLADPTLRTGTAYFIFTGAPTGFNPALSTTTLSANLSVVGRTQDTGAFGQSLATNNGTITIDSFPTAGNTTKDATLSGGSLTQVAETVGANSLTINVQAQSSETGTITQSP